MLSAVKDLTNSGINKVGPVQWKKFVKCVQKTFEDKYWLADGLQEESIVVFRMGCTIRW